MSLTNNKKLQYQELEKLCQERQVNFNSLKLLLESSRVKKIKRSNYHQQAIADIVKQESK